jgi:hypothetical protein
VVHELKIQHYEPLEEERFYSDRRRGFDDKESVLTRPLVGIDSEGANDSEGFHHLTHLQALWEKRGSLVRPKISSLNALSFITQLPPKHTYVIFAGNYDANMWLKDLPREALKSLFETSEVEWHGFKIYWVPHKFITIKHGTHSRTIYDVFSWFQCSFVKACERWEIGSKEQRQLIQDMKEKRGDFANVDQETIGRYCWLELELLNKLVDKFRDKLQRTKYRPRALYGPGALASSILQTEKIKDYYGPFDESLALHAYYGGRFDTAMFGWFEQVYQHDIRSAYPDQIRYLPCLRHANWEPSRNPATSRYGFYHVRWRLDEDTPYPPFPWRDDHRRIYYPSKGEGWYHAEEVRAAMEIYGKRIRIIEGMALREGCNCQPFKFVEELYAWRLLLESEGNKLQALIVKLCLNSLYGKMAQSIGHKNRKPPFQNFFYAGAITAGTRAKILRAIGTGEGVISIATDGLVTEARLPLPEGKQLGEWEIIDLLSHVQLGNGIYYSVDYDGKRVEKSRGFGTHLIDYDKVHDQVQKRGPWGYFYYEDKARFITLRQSYAWNRPEVACRWMQPEDPPHIQLDPDRRIQWAYNVEGKYPPYEDGDTLQWQRVPIPSQGLSAPFTPKQSWGEINDMRAQYYPEVKDEDY